MVVPASELVTLGRVLRRCGGSVRTGPFGTTLSAKEYSAEGAPVISAGEVGDGRLILSRSTRRVGPAVLRRLTDLLLQDGDIVFARKGSVDRSAIILPDEKGAFLGSDGIRVRFGSGVNPHYLAFWFQTADTRKWLVAQATGTTMLTLTQGILERVPVSLPSLPVQNSIAAILGDVDALIVSLYELIAKKQAMKQGIMQELLTGRTRLAGFSGDWVARQLGDIARIKTGTKNNQDKSEGGQYPFYVRSPSVERIDTYSYDCEAILVPGEGNIGSIFHYINGKFEVHQRVYKISDFTPNLSGKFIYYVLEEFFGVHALENSVKATVDSLRLPTFTAFTLAMPPTKDEQDAIARTLEDADAEIAALDARLAKARDIKQGMMQELLTGSTRLVSERSAP